MLPDYYKDNLFIIYFRSDDVISKFIRLWENLNMVNDEFSHVGLLMHSDHLDENIKISNCLLNKNKWIVIESTSSGYLNDGVYDTCGNVNITVQIRFFDDLLEKYNGKKGGRIAISKIKPLSLENIETKKKLNTIIKNSLGISYEKAIINLFSVHINIPTIPNMGMFCSEFVYLVCSKLLNKTESLNPKKISPNSINKIMKIDLGPKKYIIY